MVSDYSGPMRSSAPSGSPSRYTDPQQIDAVLKSSDPGAVAEAGRSYQKFAQAYEKIAGHLLSVRDDLNDAWGGNDAAAAQSQLREVWSAATTVHKTADAFGSAIETHGSEYLAWYKDNKPPSTSLAEAQSWMTGANERVTQSWSSLPPDLSTTLPPGRRRYSFGSPSDDSPSGAGGSGGAASSGVALGGGHRSETLGDLSQGDAGAGGSGTELAGYSPSGDPSAPGLGILPGGGTSSPLSSGGGFAAGPGNVSSGEGLIGFGPSYPTTPGTASGGRLPGSPGAAASEAAAAESGAGARAGGAMSPMIGGREAEDRERRRQSWLSEDEDVWTGDVEANPELIGAVEPAGGETAEETPAEPAIEIDLADGGDELATILAELEGHPDPELDARPEDISSRIDELREELAKLERQRDAESGLPPAIEGLDSDRDWLSGDGI